VITNIGLDHTQFLGDTLEKIAFEKGGIIKETIPCVIGSTQTQTKPVFTNIADTKRSQLFFAEKNPPCPYPTDLLGDYQKENSKTALQTIKLLQQKGWDISEDSIINGFKAVIKNTGLQGRWQKLNNKPLIICDTAHNTEGLKYVISQLLKQPYKQLHIVLGFVQDKNLQQVLPLFPKQAIYYFTKPNNQRALNEIQLQKEAFILEEVLLLLQKFFNFLNVNIVFLEKSSIFAPAISWQ